MGGHGVWVPDRRSLCSLVRDDEACFRFECQTPDTRPHSRGTTCPRFAYRCPSRREQGMPDARCTRGPVCKLGKVNRTRAYRAAENIRHSLRNGLTAYGALTPENSWPLSPPSPHGNRHPGPVGPSAPPQDLTPTSFRHRVHTLLPYASAPLVCPLCDRSRSYPPCNPVACTMPPRPPQSHPNVR